MQRASHACVYKSISAVVPQGPTIEFSAALVRVRPDSFLAHAMMQTHMKRYPNDEFDREHGSG